MIIDTARGMELVGGDKDLYNELLVGFYKAAEDKQALLSRYLEAGDMPNYAIEVHATKGLSANIGAEELRAKAYEHEMKSKAGDAAFCAADFNNLIELWDRVLAEIEELAGDAINASMTFESNGLSISDDELKAGLKRAYDALEDYDDEVASDEIKSLLAYDNSDENKNKLVKIFEQIDDLEYKKAQSLIESFWA